MYKDFTVSEFSKRWSSDLAVPGSRPAGGGNLPSRKRGSIAHRLSLSPSNVSCMTETLLKGLKKTIINQQLCIWIPLVPCIIIIVCK